MASGLVLSRSTWGRPGRLPNTWQTTLAMIFPFRSKISLSSGQSISDLAISFWLAIHRLDGSRPACRPAQAKAQTPEYAKVRKEHPAIERKLSALVRRHDIRHARYRGLSKVLRQALLTGVAVNLKRIVKLRARVPDPQRTGTVRAELGLKA